MLPSMTAVDTVESVGCYHVEHDDGWMSQWQR